MNVLLKEFKDRLRQRTTKSTLENHMNAAEENTRLKLDLAWKNKSPPFSKEQFEEAIKNLNVGKARDSAGLCAELLKSNVMG